MLWGNERNTILFSQHPELTKYILITRQEELDRELRQISLLKKAPACGNKQPVLSKLLESSGWLLVKFGNYLVCQYGSFDCYTIRQPKIKTS